MAKRKPKPHGGAVDGGDRQRRVPQPMKPVEFVEVQTKDLPGGNVFFAELAEFWERTRSMPIVDLIPHYNDPGPESPKRPSVERLIKRLDEFLAVTGRNTPPGFAEAATVRAWAADHNLLCLWAYSNFWFALTATEIDRSGASRKWRPHGINRWPVSVKVALDLLLDLRAEMAKRWGLTLETGTKVEMPGNPPHFPKYIFTCGGPSHPRFGIDPEPIRPTGPLVVPAEE
jgi:hypothetical protein